MRRISDSKMVAREYATTERLAARADFAAPIAAPDVVCIDSSEAAAQQFLDAFGEMIGPLTAADGPYPLKTTRRNCVLVAEK